MFRLPILLNEHAPKGSHDYDVYINTPEALAAKGHECIIRVFARNRTQAAALAKREGYTVRSVNMVG